MNNELILDLYKKNCIKFGKFTLKSGEISPIYVDLKAVISYNFLINKIVNSLQEKIKLIDFDIICGIPYGAIVYTSILANKYNYQERIFTFENENIINAVIDNPKISLGNMIRNL